MAYDLNTRIAVTISLFTLMMLVLLSWFAHLFFERHFKQTTIIHLNSTVDNQQARAFLALDNMGSRQYDFKLEQGDTRLPLIIQASSLKLRDHRGKRAGVVTVLQDVSRERELDRLKNEFISTAAHEMRTPMSVILGYVDLLLDVEVFGAFAREQQREFLAEIHAKAESLSRLVDDLFDISRIEAGLPLPFEFGPCNLYAVI